MDTRIGHGQGGLGDLAGEGKQSPVIAERNGEAGNLLVARIGNAGDMGLEIWHRTTILTL